MGTAVLTPAAFRRYADLARAAFRRYWFPAGVWGVISLVLVLAGQLSVYWSGRTDHRFPPLSDPRRWLDVWFQFDGWEYVDIADRGYSYAAGTRANVVFFPLYPMLIRAVSWFGPSHNDSALIISFAAGLAATLVFWRWLGRVGLSPPARTAALGVLLLYPYGWFLFGVVYSDALFLALVIGAFCLVERRAFVAAGLVGALATATRPTGLALIPALLVLALEREGALVVPATARWWIDRFAVPVSFVRERWRPHLMAPLLSVLGVAAYMTYLGVRWGNPLLWGTNQTVYHPTGLFTIFKGGLVGNLVHWTDPVYTLTITAQALIALAVLVTAPAVGRRFGWGYAVLVITLVLIPSVSTSDFNGTGRYLLAAFPTAALAGEWLSERTIGRRVWLGASGALLVVLTMGFARSVMLT